MGGRGCFLYGSGSPSSVKLHLEMTPIVVHETRTAMFLSNEAQ